jgi:hypothetical protein
MTTVCFLWQDLPDGSTELWCQLVDEDVIPPASAHNNVIDVPRSTLGLARRLAGEFLARVWG